MRKVSESSGLGWVRLLGFGAGFQNHGPFGEPCAYKSTLSRASYSLGAHLGPSFDKHPPVVK